MSNLRKYVCFSNHGRFVFVSKYRLNSSGNIDDARKAFWHKSGSLYPSYDFQNIVNWKDYQIDEPAIN